MTKLAMLLALLACAPVTMSLPDPPSELPPLPAEAVIAPAELRVDHHVLNTFAWMFAAWRPLEWPLCLYGAQKADTVFVERSELGYVIISSPSMSWFNCRETQDLVGLAHGHANEQCWFSSLDDKGRNPAWLTEIIVCKKGVAIYRMQGQAKHRVASIPAANF